MTLSPIIAAHDARFAKYLDLAIAARAPQPYRPSMGTPFCGPPWPERPPIDRQRLTELMANNGPLVGAAKECRGCGAYFDTDKAHVGQWCSKRCMEGFCE